MCTRAQFEVLRSNTSHYFTRERCSRSNVIEVCEHLYYSNFIGAFVPKAPDTLKPNGCAIIHIKPAHAGINVHVAPGPFWGPSAINLIRCVALRGAGLLRKPSP